MNVANSVENLVGNTPLCRFSRFEKAVGAGAVILAKAECFNPGGSAKDRVAVSMLDEAEREGKIRPGATIIEPTSGNTGLGLCVAAAVRGYRAVIVMPDTMSKERVALMRAYGAEVVLTPGALGMAGSVAEAEKIARKTENSFIPGQFDNINNPRAHYETTGPEIFRDTDGTVDIFVAGIGTGGTVTGVGAYLKEKKPGVRIVGVEPKNSPLLTEGRAGAHGLQGIGANFVPSVLRRDLLDEILTVTEEEAYAAARLSARAEGLLVGITAGAALHAAAVLAKRPENAGKTIVALLPDTGERYLSTPLFASEEV